MSTESRVIHKKWSSADTTCSSLVPGDDHRKRRRNRTTQSCLNCHVSKRMCDRKRPCGRCMQLGMTGLCVYEVDDPSQRKDAQDENSRLRQRVAELESVIRELKNKPHPRWTKSWPSQDEEFEKSHARAQCQLASEGVIEPRHQYDLSHSSTNSNAVPNETSAEERITNETLQPNYFPSSFSPFSPQPTGTSVPSLTLPHSPSFDTHSPPSASSTDIMTPTEEHPQTRIMVAGDQYMSNDIDLASLFMPYPNIMAYGEGPGYVNYVPRANAHSQHGESCSTKYHHAQFLDGHCGCLNEATGYNVVLELSLRLRKATDILSHSASHRFNNWCPLHQRIADLDAFATTSLGNMTTSPGDFETVHPRSRANTAPTTLSSTPPTFSASGCTLPICTSVMPPSLRPWSGVMHTAEPSASYNDSFMT